MRDRTRRPSFTPALATVFLAGLLAGGCAGPRPGELSLVSGSARRDGGVYVVTALLENDTDRTVFLDTLGIEMTTYDEEGKEIARDYPFSFEGQVGPFSRTRVPLHRPDLKGLVHHSTLVLKDLRGRPLSKLKVPAEDAGPAGAGSRAGPPVEGGG